MTSIRYHCKRCGNVEYASKLDFVLNTILYFFNAIGIIIIFSLIVSGTPPKDFINSMGVILANGKTDTDNLQIREIAVNLTKCCENDDYCRIYNIYDYLVNGWYYVDNPTTRDINTYPPEISLKLMAGDCKTSSILSTSLLMNIGIDAYVDCRTDYCHCITLAYADGKKYIVDVAQQKFIELEPEQNQWYFYRKC